MSNPYAMMDLYGEIRPPSLPGSSQTSPRVRPSPRKPTFKPSKPPVAFRDKSSKFSVSNPFSVDGGIGGSSVITTATLNSTTQGQTVLNSSRLPFNAPISNRQDVQALEAWTQKELETFFVEENRGAISSIQRHISQVTVLDQTMKSLSDLIRVHCADQSALLWKIWSSASDLYGEIFNKMTQSVEELRIKLADKTLQTSILEEKVKSLRTSRNSERSAAAMLDDTNAVIRNLEEDLMLKDKELLELQSTITNIALWFPNFSKFSDSVLSRYLPPVNPDDKPVQFTPPITYNQPDATEELNKQIFLAQDYLLTDLKRLENLGIGLEIGTPFNHLHSKPDRSSSMLSSFGGAAYSPHDNTALPMGIFGGPEINKSFVAAKESEYNLQSNVDDEMAISHAVAAVQGTKGLKKTIHKPTMETTQESSEYLSEGSVRDFYKLQGKRATALDAKSGSFSTPTSLALNHAREALSQTTGSRDSIDIGMKYVVSSFEEQLELSRTKLRKTLDHMQEVEAAMQVKQSDYQSTIERLERELKVSQKREKALKDQLNAAKSEGEHILASLPTRFFASMRLPELPSLSIESMDDRFELDFEPMHILILDFMDKFVARSSFDILPWTYDTCNNLLNGQSCCLTNVQPLSFTIQDKSFASVAAALFIEYLLNKFHSSLKAKQIFDKTMSALLKKAYTIGFELDVIDTEWCHFYMKLFGIVLNPTNTTTDWVWYFESVDLNEQHISIDFSVHAYRALKVRSATTSTLPFILKTCLLSADVYVS